jgi:DoxX-like family
MTMYPTNSNKLLWIGRVVSAVPVLFLLFDSGIKLNPIAPVVEAFGRLGYPVSLALEIGLLELLCLLLYLIPRTAVLGAILLTGFLSGAIAIHVRVGDPLFSHILFPAYVGGLLWAGILLRNEQLRAVLFTHADNALNQQGRAAAA